MASTQLKRKPTISHEDPLKRKNLKTSRMSLMKIYINHLIGDGGPNE